MERTAQKTYPLPLKLAGVGCYLPKRIVPSSELEVRCGLPEGWCERKQGVRERRWVTDETASFMGAEAVKAAVAHANLEAADIQLIIHAAQSFEQAVPDSASLIQQELGPDYSGTAGMSVTAACLSFLTALDISAAFLTNRQCQNIVIVTPEINTGNLDFENPNVCTMLGDGAAAIVVTRTPDGEESGIHAILMETYSEAAGVSSISGSSTHTTFFRKDVRREDFVFEFDPQSLQSTGMKYNKQFLAKLWPSSNYRSLKLVIPNQASRLTLDYAKLVFHPDKIMGIIDRFGNCGALGYPLALCEAITQGRIERGDMVLLTGMGAGFSLMGIVLTY